MVHIAAIALFVCSLGSQGAEDPVIEALTYSVWDRETSVTEKSNFDEVLSKTAVWTGTKFPKMAAELRRLANPSPKLLADAERLYKEYFTKPANPGGRALFAKGLEAKDIRPDLADAWLYLLLKPGWRTALNGTRTDCLLAFMKCDEERGVRLVPEYRFAKPIIDGYTMNCLIANTENKQGLAMMRETFTLSQRFDTGVWYGFVKHMNFILRHEASSPWFKLLEEELKTAKGGYAQGISQMLYGQK